MAGKLTARSAASLAKTRGRYLDGGGLFLRVLDPGHRVYWVYRFTTDGREREKSVGAYPEMSLAQARIKHAKLRAQVLAGTEIITKAAPRGTPTFGQWADRYIATHEGGWKNAKHHQHWVMTLTKYCAPLRDLPVDQIDAKAVLKVLEPLWTAVPETASRLRARIESVLSSAQVGGHIDPDRPNPARWKRWLDQMLPNPKKVGERRGHHAAMPYADLPAFMAKLAVTPGVASQALAFTILTCVRTGEALGATWDEISFDEAVWRVPSRRMKMAKPHDVPLSDAAVAILRTQEIRRTDRNDPVFPGRPMRPLSNMAMAMLMRRLGAGDFTVHGMRSAARSWMADQGVAFELAEACLAHQVGNAVVQAYQRSSMLERRRPIMSAWASFLSGETADNVIELRRTGV
jgi:integrase